MTDDGGILDPTRPESASLEDVAADFLCRREAGENPQLDAYLARFPRFAEDLARLLAYDTVPPATKADATGASAGRTGATASEAGRAAAVDDPALRIGPYEVLAHVSTAGGGTVFRAKDARTGTVVALKTLDGRGSVDARDLERFRREAAVVRALELVGVVPVLDAGEDRGRHWIAMKWIEGENLRDLRAQVADPAHPLHDLRERARLVARVARTFAEVHRVNLLHRDVKPSNVMVDRSGEPMIIDFGIARADDLPELTETGDARMGTPRYLAPEIVARGNAAASPATDVYGLGLTLYELATGVEPFAGVGRDALYARIASDGPVPPRRVAPRVPFDLEAVVLRATDLEPTRRYPTMAAFAVDLERFARGEPPEKTTLRRARPFARLWARRKGPLLAAAGALTILALLGVHGWRTQIAPARARAAFMEAVADVRWFPPDLATEFDGVDADLLRRAAAASAAGDDAFRLATAWLHYRRAAYRDVVATLGAERPDETFAAKLLRDHALVLGRARDADAEHRIAMPTADLGDDGVRAVHIDAPVDAPRGDVPRDAADFNAAYDRIAGERPPATPVDHYAAAALEWSTTPTAPGARRDVARVRIEENLRRAEADPALRGPISYLRGAWALIDERPADAVPFLSAAHAASPRLLGVRILLAHALVEAGRGPEALPHLEDALSRLPAAHRLRPRLLARAAQASAAAGRAADAEARLVEWELGSYGNPLQHVALPLALRAEFALSRGDLAAARAAYEDAVERVPKWGPGYDRAADLARRAGAAAAAETLLKLKAEQQTIPVPKDPEAYLRSELRGLRPPDRVFSGGFAEVGSPDSVGGR